MDQPPVLFFDDAFLGSGGDQSLDILLLSGWLFSGLSCSAELGQATGESQGRRSAAGRRRSSPRSDRNQAQRTSAARPPVQELGNDVRETQASPPNSIRHASSNAAGNADTTMRPASARIVCFTSENVRMPSSGFRPEPLVHTAAKQLQKRQFPGAQPDRFHVQHLDQRHQHQHESRG